MQTFGFGRGRSWGGSKVDLKTTGKQPEQEVMGQDPYKNREPCEELEGKT